MDREKVIKGIEMCISPDECSPDKCPYYIRPNNESGLCWDRLMTDALELLKEQEAVEPVTQSSVYDPDTWFFVCGSCKKGVIDRGDKFCRWCGQAVKWE